MAKYNVIESVNMKSTNYAERIFDVVLDEDIENGTFGYLDGLAEGETHIYKFKKGTPTAGKDLIVIDQPVWSPDSIIQRRLKESDWINKKGAVVRARVVGHTDEIGFNEKGFASKAPEVGVKLTVDANGKLAEGVADEGSFGFTVMRIRKSTVPALYSSFKKISGNDDIYEVMALKA